VRGTPHAVQSVYWQSGLLTYTVPLILLSLCVGLAACGLKRRLQNRSVLTLSLVCCVLAFVAAGFSETYATMQIVLFAVVAAGSYWLVPARIRRTSMLFSVAALAGSLAALCVVALAPGNHVRRAFFPPPPGLLTLAKWSLYYAAGFIARSIYLAPLTFLVAGAIPALLAAGRHLDRPDDNATRMSVIRVVRFLVLLPVVAFVLVLACGVPALYGMSLFLPERARIIPLFVLVCATAAWCYFVAPTLAQRFSLKRQDVSRLQVVGAVGLVALLCLHPLAAAWRTFALMPQAKANASQWDEIDREIRAAHSRGQNDVVTPLVDIELGLGAAWSELYLDRDPEKFKNRCVARYYRVNSIKVE